MGDNGSFVLTVVQVLVAIVVEVDDDVVVISGMYTMGTGCPCCDDDNLASFREEVTLRAVANGDIFVWDMDAVTCGAGDSDLLENDNDGTTTVVPKVLGNKPFPELCVNGDGMTNPPGVFIGFLWL